jgi:hypothetical protein
MVQRAVDGNKKEMSAGISKHIKCFCSVFAKRYKKYSYPKLELLSKTFLNINFNRGKILKLRKCAFLQ